VEVMARLLLDIGARSRDRHADTEDPQRRGPYLGTRSRSGRAAARLGAPARAAARPARSRAHRAARR
jgi:hypothetical protein